MSRTIKPGKRVRYVPGWDCHGLPIELKALQGLRDMHIADGSVSAAVIRKAARQLARQTVKEQMKGFRGFAVMADWENHWKTMDKQFEMRQLGIFREMVDRGLIYRKFKPVYWSPSTGTALAEAELEYKEDHVSTTALVKFPLVNIPKHLAEDPLLEGNELSAVIWTTTPWTLPANAAIAVHESLEYTIVQSENHGHLLIAQSRFEYLQNMLKEDLSIIIPSIMGSELAEKTTYRPLFKGQKLNPSPSSPQTLSLLILDLVWFTARPVTEWMTTKLALRAEFPCLLLSTTRADSRRKPCP